VKIDLNQYEKIIAYKAMTDASYLTAISDYVKAEYFEDVRIAKLFEIITDFYEKRNKLPTITEIKSYLTTDALKEQFKELVKSFSDIDKGLDKDELFQNTEEFLKERATWCRIVEIVDNAEEKIKNPQEVLEAFDEICKISLDTEMGIEIHKDINLVIEDILRADKKISTGWNWVDESLGGGMDAHGKALYMFAGQANIGKSIVLGNLATNIAKQNKTVLLISLEMSEMLYAKRLLSNITKIPMKDFVSASFTLAEALEENRKKYPKGKVFIKEFPPSSVTPKQISSFVKKMIDAGETIDAIVIDYLSLLHSTVGANSYERVKYLCEQVRAMSYTFKCPVISASQIGRSGMNAGNPGMETLSESIGTAMVSDIIVSLFQTEEDREMSVIKFGMMKNRFGPRGMIQAMQMDYSTLTVFQGSEPSEVAVYEEESELSSLQKYVDS